ncbi:MAG: HAMP domain-containing histidine kinase [Firmicutes bacterium]|nr:HAMP domain-containing histidine kinase [Bacillota bacterium]
MRSNNESNGIPPHTEAAGIFAHPDGRTSRPGRRKSGEVRSKPMAFRMGKYFCVFVIFMMALLWLLQILFLQTFYQQMKIHELKNTAGQIERFYGEESFYDIMMSLTIKSDMYIQIDDNNEILYATTSANPGDRMNAFASKYDSDLLKARLRQNGGTPLLVMKDMYPGGGENSKAMIYASILEQSDDGRCTYLFIYSPLSAVSSTIRILGMMLIIVTFIAILFGMLMSVILARRLSRPLNNITDSAEILAGGDYSVRFDGSGYLETEELASTLNYASEELSKSDKLQKDLIANVTHDLKTPLTMVKSYAEMIRDISGDNPEKREKHLQVIISEADRLNSLVNDLTTLSKMQANVDALELTDVNVPAIARETLDSFAIHREQDGFVFDYQGPESAFVRGDEKKIRQIFANLVGNAIRYSSEDKYVGIHIEDLATVVHCEVVDHGQGIDPADQDAIWDRYYRSSRNQSRTSSGTGLGLSIVKQIFILHKAKYGVRSVPGEGSCFWFDLKKEL